MSAPVLPSVRRRIREARGSAATLIVEWSPAGVIAWADDKPRKLSVSHIDSALALASSAIVCGGNLEQAWQWATPCVCEPTTAARYGANDGVDTLIAATPEERLRLARELAADEARAASLAWAGYLRTKRPRDRPTDSLTREVGILGSPLAPTIMSRLVSLTIPLSTSREAT